MCALGGDLHFTSHNSKTMTISFSPEIIDQELELAELSAISGGVPAVPPVPPLVPIIVLAGAGAALLYAAKKVREALDTVGKNLDSNCGGGDSDCSGPNKLSYSGLPEDVEDPFGGAITGKK